MEEEVNENKIMLKHVLVMMNGGRFKEYSKFIGKSDLAVNMAQWYLNKRYDLIEQYIIEESKHFIKKYALLMNLLPRIRRIIEEHTFDLIHI